MKSYSHTINQTYAVYNDKSSVKSLDLNKYEGGPSGLEHIYHKQAIAEAPYLCSPNRNLSTHYIIGIERENHPDHSSRFGYARFPNGYGVGNWSSGFYNTPPSCPLPLPKDMAPSRFYNPEFTGRNRDDTQATVDYNNITHTFPPSSIHSNIQNFNTN